jgi:hypothetical protein
MDLITCRNVLIYLEASLQKNVISLFHYALKPHGFLMLGNAESVGALGNLFSLDDRTNKVYSKRSTAIRQSVAFSTRRHFPRGESAAGDRPHAVHSQEPSWNAPPRPRRNSIAACSSNTRLRPFSSMKPSRSSTPAATWIAI